MSERRKAEAKWELATNAKMGHYFSTAGETRNAVSLTCCPFHTSQRHVWFLFFSPHFSLGLALFLATRVLSQPIHSLKIPSLFCHVHIFTKALLPLTLRHAHSNLSVFAFSQNWPCLCSDRHSEINTLNKKETKKQTQLKSWIAVMLKQSSHFFQIAKVRRTISSKHQSLIFCFLACRHSGRRPRTTA